MTERRFHRTMEAIPARPGSLKALLFPPLLNKVQNKGTQGVRARYGAELPPFISIVRYPGRPVILGVEKMLGQMKPFLVRGCSWKFSGHEICSKFQVIILAGSHKIWTAVPQQMAIPTLRSQRCLLCLPTSPLPSPCPPLKLHPGLRLASKRKITPSCA